jgi:enoyl-CoA hydratase
VSADTDEVLARVHDRVGFLTLNRPKAINSLTQTMVTAMDTALAEWTDDDDVRAVVVNGAGERGLCAGGDVVAIYHSAKAGGADARRFWFDEYRLNSRIGHYPKPYVALMDGIVMGGGVGISAHGSIRVVTDTSKIAMPEVGIGFIPDVGGTYLLSRAQGLLGLHAALTGAPFSPPTSSPTAWNTRSRPMPRSHPRAGLQPSGIGSNSAMPVRPSPTSSLRCAARARDLPTTRRT